MDTKKLTDWLEIIAAFSVVVGIILLIQEIRLNTRAVAYESTLNRFDVVTAPFFQSAELLTADEKIRMIDGVNALEAAFVERYDMTPAEALVWTRHLMQIWNNASADYHYGDREMAEFAVRALLTTPDNRLFVEHWYGHLTDEFSEFVRANLPE